MFKSLSIVFEDVNFVEWFNSVGLQTSFLQEFIGITLIDCERGKILENMFPIARRESIT